MNKNSITCAARACIRILALALMLLGLGTGSAYAAMTIVSVTMPPGGPNYAKGSRIIVTVRVTLTGTSRWRSTYFSTTPSSSLYGCANNPDIYAPVTNYPISFEMTVPSSNGVYQLNVTARSNNSCGSTASPVKNVPGAIVTGAAALHHVRLIHDGSALTCAPETVSIKACANDACDTTFTGSVTANLAANNGAAWSPASISFNGGTATATVSNPTAGNSTLSGTVTSSTAPVRCYIGSSQNCSLQFVNSCSLNAVEVGKPNGSPLFTKRTGASFDLNVLSLTNGVINTNSNVAITAYVAPSVGVSGCGTTQLSNVYSGSFVSNEAGRKLITFTPNQASRNARIRIQSGSTVVCSSDAFAIRPSAFTVTVSGVDVDSAGTTYDFVGPGVVKNPIAGAPFTMTATSFAGYDAYPVINEDLVDTAVGNAGAFGGTFSTGPNASGNDFTYSEAGFFRLLPYALFDNTFTAVDQVNDPEDCNVDPNVGTGDAPMDANTVSPDGRIGCHFGNTQTEYFGRFIPKHFAITDSSMGNRSALSTCSSTFTYMGEPMTPKLTLEAQNANNVVTTNYVGDFAKLDPVTGLNVGIINVPVTGARTVVPLCGIPAVAPCYTRASTTDKFVDGVAEISLPLTFLRGVTAIGPFDALRLGIAPQDSDKVAMKQFDMDVTLLPGANTHTLVGSSIVRYGRLHIDNVYGSELLDLALTAKAQYWTGTRFATNTLDSCTLPTYAPFIATDYAGGLNATNMPPTKLTGVATLASGVGKFTIGKPASLSKKGSVQIRSTLTDYLPGYGRATFGVYRAGPVIYVRETY